MLPQMFVKYINWQGKYNQNQVIFVLDYMTKIPKFVDENRKVMM